MGSSEGSSQGSNHWYNFSIESGDPSCFKLSNLFFELLANGSEVRLPAESGVAVVAPTNSIEATYTFGGFWTYDLGYGPTTFLSSQNAVSLFYVGSTPATLAGDEFGLFVYQGPTCIAVIS